MRADQSALQFFGLVATPGASASAVYTDAGLAGTTASSTGSSGAPVALVPVGTMLPVRTMVRFATTPLAATPTFATPTLATPTRATPPSAMGSVAKDFVAPEPVATLVMPRGGSCLV
jgi:hypothetical protein